MSLPDDPKDPINLENIEPEVVDTVAETPEAETPEAETPEAETPDAESPEASLPPSPSQKYSTKYFEPSNPPTESSEESTSEMETSEEVTEAPVLSEMNIEYQAPDAQVEAVEESVPESVVPSNPFTKGTIEWIQEEEKLSQDRLIIIEEELAKSQRILKLDIAMAKVTKRGAKTKQEELDQYDNARDSLNSWVAERQGTYAWKLLEALRAERVKIDDLQKEIVDWTEKPTTEFYERTLSLKKAFIRRFRLGLIGIISSLLIGTVVGLILNALGLGLLVNLLAFLGFNNPLKTYQLSYSPIL
jgi:pilus assembly protein FimV